MKNNIFLILLVACSFYSFAQEITGTTRTSDKYSEAIRQINKGYFENDFSAFNKFISDDATLSINGENFNKSQVREGFSMHHTLYKNINMPMNFIETTSYDENNNNQVWNK